MSDSNFEVEIIHGRNFEHRGKMYGRGGVYPVTEQIAHELVDSKRGKLVKGKLAKRETPMAAASSNQEFLQMVRANASAIAGILKTEFDSVLSNSRDSNIEVPENYTNETGTPAIVEETSEVEGTSDTETASETSEEDEASGNMAGADENEGTSLPGNFPGHKILTEAGFTTLESIPTEKEELVKLGLSERQVNSIGVRVAELKGE